MTTNPDEAKLTVALDALRKIALGHPCDLPVSIARVAVSRIQGLRS